MAIRIVPYEEQHIVAVSAFNERLRERGVHFQFPEHPTPKWLPPTADRRLFQEYFLALDDDQNVRGAYILKHQQFLLNGNVTTVGDYQLPLSEGIINQKYNMVGLLLIADALKRQPLMYALGMGGLHNPLPKFLKAMRWSLHEVPFYFRIEHPFRFLRNIQPLRTVLWRRLALDAMAFSGVGPAGWKIYDVITRRRRNNRLHVEEIKRFDDSVVTVWNQRSPEYQMVAVRDGAVLNVLYPEQDRRFIRLKVSKAGEPVGWAVLLDTQMKGHKQFRNMRVGTIVDCFSIPGYEGDLIAGCRDHLKSRGVDLTISNQASARWCDGLAKQGFLTGPSNFVFAASPGLTKELGGLKAGIGLLHMNRGDGDGPINL